MANGEAKGSVGFSDGGPNESQREVKGDQGGKVKPREAKGEPNHAITCLLWSVVVSTSNTRWLDLATSLAPFGDHRLATSKVFPHFPLLGSLDDVDLKVSDGDSNFKHYYLKSPRLFSDQYFLHKMIFQ